MAAKDPDTATEFRRNEPRLFDTMTGAYTRKMAVSLLTLVVFAFVLSPSYRMIVAVFKATAEIQQIPPAAFLNGFSLEGFRLVVESSIQADGYTSFLTNLFGWQASSVADINTLSLVLNNLKVAIDMGATALVFGTAASYVLSRCDFAGRNALVSTLPTLLMFPETAIMVLEWELVSALSLFSTHFVLIFIYGAMTTSLAIWLVKGLFDDFPDLIIKALRIDQCSLIETFWYVIAPTTRSSLIALFIFMLPLAWSELVFTLTPLDSSWYTIPPGLLMFAQGFNTQRNVAVAASIIILLPVLFGLAYIQHHFAQGFTDDAIKG